MAENARCASIIFINQRRSSYIFMQTSEDKKQKGFIYIQN